MPSPTATKRAAPAPAPTPPAAAAEVGLRAAAAAARKAKGVAASSAAEAGEAEEAHSVADSGTTDVGDVSTTQLADHAPSIIASTEVCVLLTMGPCIAGQWKLLHTLSCAYFAADNETMYCWTMGFVTFIEVCVLYC